MITKRILGERMRESRTGQQMTLKDVEGMSGLSSTHVSEIERGMTSPTIGALIRIAHALNKDPSYFIEDRELEEVCITTESDRPVETIPKEIRIEGGRIEALTRGVICGRIEAYLLTLDAGGVAELPCIHQGLDVCFYCLEGQIRLRTGSFEGQLGPGDSIHGSLTAGPVATAGEATRGRLVIILDPKEECR